MSTETDDWKAYKKRLELESARLTLENERLSTQLMQKRANIIAIAVGALVVGASFGYVVGIVRL